MEFDAVVAHLERIALEYGVKVLGALVLWFVGRWVIGLVIKIVRRALSARHVDATLQQYLGSIIGVGLNIMLIVAILAQFGVQTTSFAALVAAAGIAIGAAWGSLLANFAAGAFLLVLRPFKVGDNIAAGGTAGIVEEIGLFVTTLTTADGVRTFVGNNKIFSDNIQNFTDTPYRRVDRTMQLAHDVDVDDTVRRLTTAIKNIPGVLETPAPEIWAMDFTMAGAVLAVRPYCKPSDYPRIVAATNDAIRAVAAEANLPAPELRYAMRTHTTS
ncbi:MAG: mechanosensitive ion channel family protein [Bradyrhizobiaceae bacterium]|nr:mechanosensitive ion channel family protein [Bradyrhizobiaceae bacterium]